MVVLVKFCIKTILEKRVGGGDEEGRKGTEICMFVYFWGVSGLIIADSKLECD